MVYPYGLAAPYLDGRYGSYLQNNSYYPQSAAERQETRMVCRPVASVEEAKAIPTDFNGNLMILPDFSMGDPHKAIKLPRWKRDFPNLFLNACDGGNQPSGHVRSAGFSGSLASGDSGIKKSKSSVLDRKKQSQLNGEGVKKHEFNEFITKHHSQQPDGEGDADGKGGAKPSSASQSDDPAKPAA